MASYSDHYKDVQQAAFIEHWAPESKPLPELTEDNLRWNIARANAAEAKVQEYQSFFKRLRGLVNDV